MPFEKQSLADVEKSLTDPFTLRQIAQVDELAIYAYLCMGTLTWHRHLDYDELFLVYRGTMTLETQRGTATLGPWDLAVAPKGLGHRSGSLRPATVVLIQSNAFPDRHNGDRRLFDLSGPELQQCSLSVEGARLSDPFSPRSLAHVDAFAFSVLLCKGVGDEVVGEGAEWVLVQSGRLEVESEGTSVTLRAGEFALLPAGTSRRLTGRDSAVAALLRRAPS